MKEIRDLERKGADQEGGRSVKKKPSTNWGSKLTLLLGNGF